MINTREAVAVALFTALQKATGITNAVRYARDSTALNAADLPTMEVLSKDEDALESGIGTPIRWTVNYYAFLFVSTADPGVLAETQINTLLDAIETALKPSPVTGKQTLSGVVFHCRIKGKVTKDPAFTSGIGAAAIPIEITITS